MRQQPRVPAPGYAKWRKAIRDAYALLETTYEEIHYYIEERSYAWHETERAGDLVADRDELYEILEKLDGLSVGRFKPRRRGGTDR